MNRVNFCEGLLGCVLELGVKLDLVFVVTDSRCHGPEGVDVDEPVRLPVFNLVDALIDKINL